MHKDDVTVHGFVIVTSMTDYACSTKNSSTRIGVSGDRSRREMDR